MLPILFSLGPIHIFSFSVFLIISWIFFSFIFWKNLINNGIDDDSIFDIMFNLTIVGFFSARLFYVLFNWYSFSDSILKIFAIWVAPGLSFIGALIGVAFIIFTLPKKRKIRLGVLLDSIALSIPLPIIIGLTGCLMDGTYVGTPSNFIWAIRYAGYKSFRHPIQIYEIISVFIIYILILLLNKIGKNNKWPYGRIGIWFFFLFSFSEFMLEFFKENSIYFRSLSINQWIYIALLTESIGALYVRGGGRELYQPFIRRIYATIFRRFHKPDQEKS
jgi:phosphatidylglycerol---prolipoprotein diacylglyceryl transferase